MRRKIKLNNEKSQSMEPARGEIVIYQPKEGGPTMQVRLDRDTVWLDTHQMAELFGRDRTVIVRHVRKIYATRELVPESTCAKNAQVAADGKIRQMDLYNLDMILSVGYRVNSKRGTQFRIWATGVLREHLTKGITINRQRLETNAREIEAALELARRAVASKELTTDMGRGIVEVIARYTQTFLLLQRYDEGLITEPKVKKGGVLPPVGEAHATIARLKEDLLYRKEAGDLFGQERSEGLAAILGNLRQSVFGAPAYPSIESKAAHLLYFIIKNHPFVDGNKRIGAMLFVDFLNRNRRLFLPSGEPVINDIGMAALALLVAESKPKDKEIMIRLIINMLAKER